MCTVGGCCCWTNERTPPCIRTDWCKQPSDFIYIWLIGYSENSTLNSVNPVQRLHHVVSSDNHVITFQHRPQKRFGNVYLNGMECFRVNIPPLSPPPNNLLTSFLITGLQLEKKKPKITASNSGYHFVGVNSCTRQTPDGEPKAISTLSKIAHARSGARYFKISWFASLFLS